MVFKQLFYNILEYVLLRCRVGWKIKKVEKLFSKREVDIKNSLDVNSSEFRIEMEDLKLHRSIER